MNQSSNLKEKEGTNLLGKYGCETAILFLSTIVIFCIQMYAMKDRNVITVFDDEWGYLSSAAYIAGYDWSEITSTTFFYSQGYSYLIAPILAIVKNPYVAYKLVLISNAMLMSTLPFIVYSVCTNLFPDTKSSFRIAVAICMSLYPTYIIYSSFAMTECVLSYLQWIIIWLFIKLAKEKSMGCIMLLAFLTGYSVIIHQRMLGMMVAVLIVIGVMFLTKQLNLKQILSFGIVLSIVMVAQSIIKDYFIDNLWENGEHVAINNMEGTVGKILKVFTYGGLKDTLKVLMGQIYYSGVATYLLLIIGIIVLGIYCLRKYFKVFLKRDGLDYKDITYLYMLLSYLGTAAVSAIFMNTPTSLKHIIYGRYNEVLAIPVVMCAIVYLASNITTIARKCGVFVCALGVFILSYVVSSRLIYFMAAENDRFLVIRSIAAFTGVNMYYDSINYIVDLSKATIGTIVFAIFFIAFLLYVVKKKKEIGKILLITIIGGLFIVSSLKFSREFALLRSGDDIMAGRMQSFENYISAVEYGDSELQEKPLVYALLRSAGNSFKYYAQFVFYEHEMLKVDIENLNNVPVGAYVISYRENDIPIDLFELKLQKGEYYLWQRIVR